ncbi:DUF4340 domain-containing protein [bacterium]|nr:DUF4340 domain-containing protein [bacterium]
MDRKFLQKLAIVFAVLVVIYLITIPRQKGVNVDDLVQNVVFGFSAKDVHHIEIYKETDGEPAQVLIARVEDQWRIPSHFNAKGNQSKIDNLLKDILEMTGQIRSKDPKHLETYKITDAQGIHLILKDQGEKPLANLIIGKRAKDANTGFVRFAGFEKVYAVDKNLLSTLSVYGEADTLTVLKQNIWVDLQAVDKKADDYTELALVSKGRNVHIRNVEKTKEETIGDSTVTKQVKEWVLVKNNREKDLDQKKINDFFRDVGKIRATEVVDRISNSLMQMNKINQYGLGRPSHYIIFQKADGSKENVLFGKMYEKDKGYYMQTQEDGLVYKVTKYNFDKVVKWVEDLPENIK